MLMDTIQVDLENWVKNANYAKEAILMQLLKDNILTNEQYDLYSTDYNIILIKESWFKKYFSKLINKDTNSWIYKVIKMS